MPRSWIPKAFVENNGATSAGVFAATDANMIARAITSQFGLVANVRDYGAVGNGITDDYPAFAAACAAAKTVVVPAGIYAMSQTLFAGGCVLIGNQSVRGYGSNTRICGMPNGHYSAPLAAFGESTKYIVVFAGPQAGSIGIIYYGYGHNIDQTTGWDAVSIAEGRPGCVCYSTYEDNQELNGWNDDWAFINNGFASGAVGLRIVNAQGGLVTGSVFDVNIGYQMHASNLWNTPITDNHVFGGESGGMLLDHNMAIGNDFPFDDGCGNTIHGNLFTRTLGGAALTMNAGRQSAISGNRFSTYGSGATTGISIGNECDDVTITGNTICGYTGNSVVVDGAEGAIISSNTFSGDWAYDGSSVQYGAGAYIDIRGAAKRCAIGTNTMRGNPGNAAQRSAVALGANTTKCLVDGIVTTDITTPVSNLGTGNVIGTVV